MSDVKRPKSEFTSVIHRRTAQRIPLTTHQSALTSRHSPASTHHSPLTSPHPAQRTHRSFLLEERVGNRLGSKSGNCAFCAAIHRLCRPRGPSKFVTFGAGSLHVSTPRAARSWLSCCPCMEDLGGKGICCGVDGPVVGPSCDRGPAPWPASPMRCGRLMKAYLLSGGASCCCWDAARGGEGCVWGGRRTVRKERYRRPEIAEIEAEIGAVMRTRTATGTGTRALALALARWP